VIREFPGIIVVLLYLVAVPPILARHRDARILHQDGVCSRFFVLMNLLQLMAALPIKMMLRWVINLK